MFKIDSDVPKNRLFIKLTHLDETVIKPILTDLSNHVDNLQPGFTCLVDIRGMIYEENATGAEYIEIIQGALKDAGMSKVVRLVDNDELESQEAMNKTSAALGYSAKPVFTIEEAEKILDN